MNTTKTICGIEVEFSQRSPIEAGLLAMDLFAPNGNGHAPAEGVLELEEVSIEGDTDD
jgi:hypothetical protein